MSSYWLKLVNLEAIIFKCFSSQESIKDLSGVTRNKQGKPRRRCEAALERRKSFQLPKQKTAPQDPREELRSRKKRTKMWPLTRRFFAIVFHRIMKVRKNSFGFVQTNMGTKTQTPLPRSFPGERSKKVGQTLENIRI